MLRGTLSRCLGSGEWRPASCVLSRGVLVVDGSLRVNLRRTGTRWSVGEGEEEMGPALAATPAGSSGNNGSVEPPAPAPSSTPRKPLAWLEIRDGGGGVLKLRAGSERELAEWTAAVAVQSVGVAARQEKAARAFLKRLFQLSSGLELGAGVVILNVLVFFMANAHGHLEFWMFGLALNLFVMWAVLTRFEHLLTQEVLGTSLSGAVVKVLEGGVSPSPGSLSDDDEGNEGDEPPVIAIPPPLSSADPPSSSTSEVAAMKSPPSPPHFGTKPSTTSTTTTSQGALLPPFEGGLTYVAPNRPMIRHSWTTPTFATGPALLKLVACDVGFVAQTLPWFVSESAGYLPDPISITSTDSIRLPQLVVLNLVVQKPGVAVFRTEEGPAYHLVLVFEPSEGFLQELTVDQVNPQPTGGAGVAQSFLTQPDATRLEVTGEILNPQTSDVPPWALKFNGSRTPLHTGCTARRFDRCISQLGNMVDVLEIRVDLRRWSVLFRQVANAVLPALSKLDIQLTFHVAQVPERALCGARLAFLDLSQAKTWLE